MVRKKASLIVLEILGGLILLAIVLAGILVFRLSSGPIKLEMFRDDIEKAISSARNGRPVTLDDVYLEWSTKDRRVLVTGNDLRLMDDDGNVAAEAKRARIVLAGSALVFGDVEVLGLAMQDGWVNVDETADGTWRVGGDPLPELPEGTLPQNPSEWLDRANTVLPQVLTALQQAQQEFSLERVSFENFEIRVKDAQGAPVMQLIDSRGLMSRDEDGLSLSVSGSGVGEGLPGGVAMDIRTSDLSQRMSAEFAVADWPLADLASRFGVGGENLTGLPADVSVEFDTSASAGVEQVALKAHLAEGKIPFGGEARDVSDLDVTLTYKAGEDQLDLVGTSTKAGPVSGELSLSLNDALKGTGPRPFQMQSKDLVLDLTPGFETALQLGAVNFKGHIDLPERRIEKTHATFRYGETLFKADLDLALTKDKKENEPPILGTIELETEGAVTKNTVLALWPVGLGTGARNFTDERIEAADVSGLKGRLELKRDSLAEGYLRDEDLNLTFNVTGAQVRFLDDLPAVKNAAGKGRLTGNSFRVTVDSADYGGWDVDEALVDFPAFNPKGEDFRVFAKGRGPVQNIIRILNESRLQLDFDAERLSGDAEMTFEMFRPALDDVPYEDVRFTAIGTLENGGLKNAALGLNLKEASSKINVDQDGIMISGFGELGPAPVQYTWRDGFNDDDQPSALTASAIITADVLNRFGLPGRAYLTGEVPAEIQASIADESVSLATISADLTEARIDLSELGWIKPAGDSGKVSVVYSNKEDGFSSDVLFTSAEAYFDGTFALGKDSRLISADVRRAYLADTADVKGDVRRGDDGNLVVGLEGTYLDLTGALPGLGAIENADSDNGTPLRVDANLDTLTLGPGLNVRGATASWYSTSAGMQRFAANGATDDGSPFEVNLDGTGTDGTDIHVVSGDAGFLASAFLGLDFLEGGKLEVDGKLAPKGQASKFEIVITNGRVRNAPVLTQILSLASLRGLADTLGGEGVLFSRIDIPLTLAADRYVVTGGKAQGPALGLTVNGFLESGTNEISVDGVLVPSFGMNSALGSIPIIGDLVVGRDGEGVFSLTYSVRGSLEKANVSVNPLSALAPGVIRRVFENPADTSIPEAKPRPEDEPIPSELPPIPEEEF
ncbi:hypothetical protein HY29_12140 [Hyphomonas beringensis]|uniref:YhdP central domain-containing protein n=1 Tax=Hyphomonas beringensis TaxID=1280946 RepID=A0A062U547_9PROT|nr:DUF3971 domain-containing protein [Hyphomonas beringensis]KCZ55466.1 hypothetical protein HY29_12140 [Hyphomonas beringensis]